MNFANHRHQFTLYHPLTINCYSKTSELWINAIIIATNNMTSAMTSNAFAQLDKVFGCFVNLSRRFVCYLEDVHLVVVQVYYITQKIASFTVKMKGAKHRQIHVEGNIINNT